MDNYVPEVTMDMLQFYNQSANSSLLINNTSTAHTTPSCKFVLFILYGIVCGIICILGFMGNVFSFLVLVKDQASPVASFLLQTVAIADNCFLVLWMIHYSVRQYHTYFTNSTSVALIYIRMYTFPILYMAQMETIWLTVVIAMNRFMAVCLPYRAPHLCTIYNVYKEVVIVTIFSIVYNIPKCFERYIVTSSNSTTVTWNYTELGKNTTYRTVYNDAMYYIFTFILPLMILMFINTKVIIAYQALRKRKKRMTTRRQQNDNNITLVMIIVVVVFMVCQAPARLVQMIYAYSFNTCTEAAFFLIHISNTFEVLNSSVNFVIYAIFRKRFCDVLLDNFCCGPLKKYSRKNSTKSLTTEGMALSEYGKSTIRKTSDSSQKQKANNIPNITDDQQNNANSNICNPKDNGKADDTHLDQDITEDVQLKHVDQD